jgi:hypothetical protein
MAPGHSTKCTSLATKQGSGKSTGMCGGLTGGWPSTGLSFEGAAGASGEFDLIFGAGFFGVLLEGQID